MIWLDDNGKIIIRTNIEARNVNELQSMKQTVLDLLATQDENFHDRNSNYWAFELVKLLEPEPEQICLHK